MGITRNGSHAGKTKIEYWNMAKCRSFFRKCEYKSTQTGINMNWDGILNAQLKSKTNKYG
jgi:hypothetical protein